MPPDDTPQNIFERIDLAKAQRILGILLRTRCVLRCVANTGSGIGDGVSSTFGSIANGARQAFGGVTEGVASATDCRWSVHLNVQGKARAGVKGRGEGQWPYQHFPQCPSRHLRSCLPCRSHRQRGLVPRESAPPDETHIRAGVEKSELAGNETARVYVEEVQQCVCMIRN